MQTLLLLTLAFFGVGQATDWRANPCMGPVRDEGAAGSVSATEAFIATESVECALSATTPCLDAWCKVSRQQLLDCAGGGGDGGAFFGDVFKYMQSNGLEKESDYPLSAKTGSCHYNRAQVAINVTALGGTTEGAGGSEESLEAALSSSPIAAVITVGSTFEEYTGGELTDCGSGGAIVVEVVAAINGTWTVKANWGMEWGEDGYARIKMGVGACGIGQSYLYPKDVQHVGVALL